MKPATHISSHLNRIMPIHTSDSDDEPSSHGSLLVGHKSLHTILGGGRVADVLLWKDKRISAAILLAATVIWMLFEVVEYNFVTLLCHISITAMLVVFIWSNGAALFDRHPPKIPEIILSKSAFEEVALTFHVKLNRFISTLFDIACGKELSFFLLAIASLWILSVVGSYFSSINLLYFGFVCVGTLPAFYNQYQKEVDRVARKGNRNMKKLYRKFDSEVLNKIPRGPVKQKKSK